MTRGTLDLVHTPLAERTLDALRASDALLDGHFLLSSGRHAARYVQCAQLLQHPERAAAVCTDLAERIRSEAGARPCDVVVGPAMGAVTFAYELGRALGTRALFAERAEGGGFALRRGFRVEPGERVLVAEDVVTTGGSAREVLAMLEDAGARIAGVAAIAYRGDDAAKVFAPHPFFRCVDLQVPSWPEEECPLCREGDAGPAVKPGTRPDAG